MELLKKNKKYFLLAAVIILYGLIGFKIKHSLSNENKTKTNETFIPIDTKVLAHKKVSDLDFNYRNPFKQGAERMNISNSGSLMHKKESSITSRNNSQLKQSNVVKQDWPSIKLLAVILNNKTKVCVVNIDKSEEIITESSTVRDIQIIKIFKDSVYIGFNGQIKTIRL
jgi:hypothetical protein